MNTPIRWFLSGAWLALGLALVAMAALEVRSAWRERHEPNEVVIPLRVDRRGPAQLFYDIGRGINESDSVTRLAWPTRELRELRFPAPAWPVRQLRFDPLSAAGALQIGAVRIETAAGRRLAVLPLSAIQPQNQIATLVRHETLVQIETIPSASDPMLRVALPDSLVFAPRPLPWGLLAGVGIVAISGLILRAEGSRLWQGLRRAATATARPGGLAGFWLGAVLAGVVQLWFLWPLHRVLDLPLWDESGYMAWSARWADPASPGHYLFNCPLYVLQYLVELRILGDTGTAFFFHHYFFKTASTVLLYAIVARWWRCWPAALSLVLLWALSAFQAQQAILIYQAALFWLFLAILAADASPLVAIGCLLLAACVRQEYQFALAAFTGWLAWRKLRGRLSWPELVAKNPDRRLFAAAASVPLFVLAGYVLSQVSVTGSSDRAWFAFQQHYAVRAVAEGNASGINPWIDYPQLMQRDFPGAHSLAEAVRRYPAKVAGHLAGNLARVPAALVELLRPSVFRWTSTPLLIGALLALAWWRRSAMDDPVGLAAPGTALIAAALLALAPGLFIYAKDAYLLAAMPAIALLCSATIHRLVRLLPPLRLRNHAWSLAILLAAIMVAAASDRPFATQTKDRPVAETIAALDFHWPANQPLKLLAVPAVSYRTHLGAARCTSVEGMVSIFGNTRGDAPFDSLLETARPDVVLLTPDWTSSGSFDQAAAERLLHEQGWLVLPLTRGTAFFRPHGPVTGGLVLP